MKNITIICFLLLFSFYGNAQCGIGTVVISEVYFDTHYSESPGRKYNHCGEYIELFNSSNVTIDLDGWKIKDNKTEFVFPAGTSIAPGSIKIITFGRHDNTFPARQKFVELFPEAAGHEEDIIVQDRMVLYNDADKLILYNYNGGIVDQISYYNNSHKNSRTRSNALQYLGLSNFDLDTTIYNDNGGIFNGAIHDEFKLGFHLSESAHYYETAQDRQYQVANVTPFSIPFSIPTQDPGYSLFAALTDAHWLLVTDYDIKNTKVGEAKTFFNDLALPTTTYSLDVRTGKIWGQEKLYDSFNRLSKESFPALICSMSKKIGFLSDNYFYENHVKWFYSDNNSLDAFQATTEYPLSITNYDELNPGNIINIVGGNKINGEWKTGYSYTVPAAQEMYYLYGKDYYNGPTSTQGEEVITKFYKQVTIDQHGVETVYFMDAEGKVLATARSGGSVAYPVVSLIGLQGYVDVHIPAGINSGISLIGNASDYKIYNLRTGQLTTTLSGGNIYRIEAVVRPILEPKVYITASGGIAYEQYNAKGIQYNVNYYEFSLNCYNSVGQLVKQVQPKGIAASIFSSVLGVPPHMSPGASAYISNFSYNSDGSLSHFTSPDEGTTKFKYRRDGLVRFSQNSLETSQGLLSYTNYDSYGRAVESGTLSGSFSWAALDADGVLPAGTKSSQVFAIYDFTGNILSGQTPPQAFTDAFLNANGLIPADYRQKNLSGHVAVTYSISAGTTTTWYSYDIYGRIEWLIQYNPDTSVGLKTLHYLYDHHGNVVKVIFQKDKAGERFIHRYTYDADALTKVETSVDNITYITHNDYKYNISGKLSRQEYSGGIQGVDYVYTLGGMLKSINHPSLEQAKDPGNDANDLFGLTLDYYSGDYLRSGPKAQHILSSPAVSGVNSDLYDGTIKAVRWANKNSSMDLVGSAIQQKAYLYAYNSNKWLTNAVYGTTNNTAAITPMTSYREGAITYDANGNIMTLQRTNNTGAIIDNFNYVYSSANNRLDFVNDQAGTTPTVNYDIEPQLSGNYVYNSIGQLTQNVKEDLSYSYNAAGLVTEVKKTSIDKVIVKFFYNERGHRVKKEMYSTTSPYGLLSTDYYVLDLEGNTLAVYNKTLNASVVLKEHSVYGIDRIGVFNRLDGTTNYELKDHLGNVRVAFKKQSQTPVMNSWADYYPFGELLPTRNSMSSYRYAFQGQELDQETNMEAFPLRLWDGRIGRWLSPDPYMQFYSPYLGMGNNPISGIDKDGGYVYILGKDGQLYLALNYVLSTEIGDDTVGKFVNDPDNHLIIAAGELTSRPGTLGNTMGPLIVTTETELTEANFDTLLDGTAKKKPAIFGDGIAKEMWKKNVAPFLGVKLQPGNNYLITVDINANLEYGTAKGRGILMLLETVWHEPAQHAHDENKTGRQDHLDNARNIRGNSTMTVGKDYPLYKFLQQIQKVQQIEAQLQSKTLPSIIQFAPNSNQIHYVSKSPRYF
jgi:RHS repeat-associated protein